MRRFGVVAALLVFVAAGCASPVATPIPTATPTRVAVETVAPDSLRTEDRLVEPPGHVRTARDAVLSHIREHHGEQAPAPGLAWTGKRTTPEGWAGEETFEFTFGGWVVTISYGILKPMPPYEVVVTNQTSGFRWEGECKVWEVDAAGKQKMAKEPVVVEKIITATLAPKSTAIPTTAPTAGPSPTSPVSPLAPSCCLVKIPAERPAVDSWKEIITGYQLQGQLPQTLPRTAPVFRLQVPDGSLEWAETIARPLGFSSQLIAMQSSDPDYPEYHVSEGSPSLQLWSISGAFNYQDSQLLSPSRPPERLPKDEAEAISIAQAFLEQRGFLPTDCTIHPEAELVEQSWPDPKDPDRMIQSPNSWEVRFPRYLEGGAVRGFWMSGVRVTLGEGGEVAAFTYLHREAEGRRIYPLKMVEEAWQELLAGRAAHLDSVALGTGAGKPEPFSVLVEEVGLGYREAEVMRLQPYLQPYYLFEGMAQTPNGEVPITLYVPALAQEWLEEPR